MPAADHTGPLIECCHLLENGNWKHIRGHIGIVFGYTLHCVVALSQCHCAYCSSDNAATINLPINNSESMLLLKEWSYNCLHNIHYVIIVIYALISHSAVKRAESCVTSVTCPVLWYHNTFKQ